MTLTDALGLYRNPKAHLEAAGLSPKRALGQNFLADANIALRIANFAVVDAREVLEIGAGLGALTAPLLERVPRVVAVETDSDMVTALRERFVDALSANRLEIVHHDARDLDFITTFKERSPARRVLAGNLPYGITGPLFRKVCGVAGEFCRAVFLVQLEVAERLAAKPSTAAYGALSVFVQRAYQVKRALTVRRGAFYPSPNVDSAVVVLSPLAQPLTPETQLFKALVTSAFQKRRKQLKNAWSGLQGLAPVDVAQAAAGVGIELSRRGETLRVEEFARMARALAG